MSWTAPFTAVAGSVLTAAQVNTFIRDNLNETMPAKATTSGSIFSVGNSGALVERTPAAQILTASVQITSTSFDDPSDEGTSGGEAGPTVTVLTGPMALVGYRALVTHPSATARIEMSYAISGATSRDASTVRSLGYSLGNGTGSAGINYREGVMDLAVGLESGLNTFTLKYNVSSGTGTVNDRRLWAVPL